MSYRLAVTLFVALTLPAVFCDTPAVAARVAGIDGSFSELVRRYVQPSLWDSVLNEPIQDSLTSPTVPSAFLQEQMRIRLKVKAKVSEESAELQQTLEQSSSTGGDSLVGECETCIYVIENKEQHQPYLCRGLKDDAYQKSCVEVMTSMMWWLTNEVYWLNYGCQSTTKEFIRPCPPHAICGWIENLYTRKPFCTPDAAFPKPQ